MTPVMDFTNAEDSLFACLVKVLAKKEGVTLRMKLLTWMLLAMMCVMPTLWAQALDLPDVQLTNETVLFESNVFDDWDPTDAIRENRFSFIAFFDQDVTIDDVFFSTGFAAGTSFDGQPITLPSGLQLVIRRYRNLNDTFLSQPVQIIETFDAKVYNCPSGLPFTNKLQQVAGATDMGFQLRRGAYMFELQGSSPLTMSEFMALMGTSTYGETPTTQEFKVVATGSPSSSDVWLFNYNEQYSLTPLINGATQGLSMSEILQGMDAALLPARVLAKETQKHALHTAEFSNTELLFDSDTTNGWSVLTTEWIIKTEKDMYCVFFVDEEATISDFFFSSAFRNFDHFGRIIYPPENLNLEIRRYTALDALDPAISLSKAQLYLCPTDHPFIHNSFTHLVGVSNLNLVLPRGVYQARILPSTAISTLLGAANSNDYHEEYGVGVTGSSAAEVILLNSNADMWKNVLIEGVNNGLTNAEMVTEYENLKIVELEVWAKLLEDQRKAEAEQRAAAALKAATDAAAKANAPITLKVNGKTIATDSPAVIVSGRTLVPMRALVEALGFVVSWDSSDQSISIYEVVEQNLLVHMTLESRRVRVSTGIYGVMDERIMDVAPQSINGRTMIPARFIAEWLGCTVVWTESTKTISITTNMG